MGRAMYTTEYFLKRESTRGVIGVTPETWSRRKLKVSHFEIVSSITYSYKVVLEENNSEFNAICRKLLFISYFDQAKTYRVLGPCTSLVVVRM